MGINIKINSCYLYSKGVVATKEEASSISSYLDNIYPSLYANSKTYEDGEKRMLVEAITFALDKAKMAESDLDYILGGDLSDQINNSSSVASFFKVPFLGVYGACSTSLLAMGIGAILIQAKMANNVLTYTSSSYGVAERQFRNPTEYGIQKKNTVTITVSGAAALILSSKKSKIRIASVSFGRVIDSLSKDVTDMGSIMALGAFDTINKHLQSNHEHCVDYDMILTGDLSKVGLKVLKDMFETEKEETYMFLDAGEYIYRGKTSKLSGGSGPACLPLVAFTYIINEMNLKHLKKVLLVATGALHSKKSTAQKNSIPVIAHAIELRSEEL